MASFEVTTEVPRAIRRQPQAGTARDSLRSGLCGFAVAGRELAHLHVEYESLDPWPLESVENKDVPYSERVAKMSLSADRQSLKANESLTLAGIPAETFSYRLGSRSALDEG